ncbi:MAG TPA: menaquinone-dependent protoporphyrinogen IX dehydrogenase [Caldimonas sp.]|nr:menaquinone-dependent protoporphyrinogen IX dehydrogenase [Caldimonas sp.]
MKRVLLLCSSTDGQTRKICDRLREMLQDAGAAVTLTMIEDAREVSPDGFQMAVIGARIRYGMTDARVIAFANRHAVALNAMPSAYFSVNIVARKPEKNRPETNPYVQAFVRRVAWRPGLLDVFAGKLDYPRYGVLDRMIIRFIMWLTRGPTGADAVVEYTDWQRVDAFGQALCAVGAR